MKLNVFYHPENDLVLSDYGIQIPVAGDRALNVFNSVPGLHKFDFSTLVPFTTEDLRLAHNDDYVARLFGSEEELVREIMTCFELVKPDGSYHRYDPQTARKKLHEAFKIILQRGALTYISTKAALKDGFSFHLGGGMHHAMSFGGRGFGLINDIVISLRKLQNEKMISHAWVVDVDAHKGDGTAELTQNDPTISTLSIHMAQGWPLDQGNSSDPWFIPSDVEIGIEADKNHTYLERLNKGLMEMENKFPRPDVVIVVDGADPYEHDELASTSLLKLKKEEILERDKLIFNFFKERNIPQSYVMAGGYGKRSWEIYSQFLNYLTQL